MTAADWAAFREAVFHDADLARSLASTDAATFSSAVAAAATERGFSVDAAEVDAAVNAGRRAWFERWI